MLRSLSPEALARASSNRPLVVIGLWIVLAVIALLVVGRFLDFWASWCGPCIGAVPYLEEIKQRTRDQKVVFLNVSLDSADEWHQAVEEHGLTGVHVHALGGWRATVTQLYQVRGIPSYFLVGPDGRMDGRMDDVDDVEEVVAHIEEVISGKVPSSTSGQSGIIIKE